MRVTKNAWFVQCVSNWIKFPILGEKDFAQCKCLNHTFNIKLFIFSAFQYFELFCAMLAGLRVNVATLANLQKRVRIASDESVKVRSKKVELQKWICVISKSSWGPLLATAAIKYYSFCNSNFLTAPHPRNCTNYRSYRSAFALLG